MQNTQGDELKVEKEEEREKAQKEKNSGQEIGWHCF